MRKLLMPALLSLVACTSAKEATRDEAPAASAATQSAPAQEGPSRMAYPATRSDAVMDTLHGQQVADPYRWLEDEKAPEVQAWMKAQDGFTRDALAKMPGRDALAKRFTELFYVDSVTAPFRRGNRFFYMRTHKDKEKAIVYWKDGESGQEKVLLDPNAMSKDAPVSLGRWVPSWDGKRVAFPVRPNAADEATLHVIDVDTGEWSKVDVIEGAKYANTNWTPDGKGFYYEWLPTDPSIPVDARPGYTTLKFHKLGEDPKKDVVVHERTGDPTTFLQGDLSRDGKYLFASILRGWSENDVYWKHPAEKDWRLLVKGKGAKYSVLAWKDRFYVVTDEGAPRQRVFAVDPKKTDRANWKEVVPEDPKATLESVSLVGGHLALEYLKDVTTELRITTLEGKPVRTVQLPGVGAASNLTGLEDQDDAYFSYSSFTTPRQVYRTSVKSGKVDLWAKVEVPMDPDAYTTEQVFYTSKDGTKVPMFLVYKKGLKKDGTAPTLLYGYGGFLVSMQPGFRASILPWLDAGGIYAVANLRGGGEYGTAWHEAGKGANKQNVFDDFAGAAEYLAKEKYTQAKKLAIYGGSNGGLLVGAAMTQRPELYGAVVCGVPLLDMVRFHLFGSGRTWVPEYGSADDAGQFKTLYAYSPYHHVRQDVQYPPLLMMSSDHDDRVDPMHARKFVAAVQNAKSNPAPTLLRIEANAGHGGADQVAKAIESSVDMYAFLFQALGVAWPDAGVAAESR